MMHSGPDTAPFVPRMLFIQQVIPQWYLALTLSQNQTHMNIFLLDNARQWNFKSRLIQTQQSITITASSFYTVTLNGALITSERIQAAAFSSLQHWKEEECGWQWEERETCNEKFGCSHEFNGQDRVNHLHRYSRQCGLILDNKKTYYIPDNSLLQFPKNNFFGNRVV